MEKNYEVLVELNTTPRNSAPTWSDLGVMFKNVAQSLNEVLYQTSYLKDRGWGSTEVTGGQFTITLTGDKKPGDAVNDYIFSPNIQLKFGDARKTQLRLTRGLTVIIWEVTLANITDAGGDSNQPNAVTLTIHGNGAPSVSSLANTGSRLEALTVGTLLLNPSFTPGQFGYAATTSNAADNVTAVAEAGGASVEITLGEDTITNGSAAAWAAGQNILVIRITNGSSASVYTVVVTKTA